MPQIRKSPSGVWEISKLNGTRLILLFPTGVLPDSIVDVSQLETFRLSKCHKLENLLRKFEKLQSLVELDLFGCSKLGCLPDSIVDLSELKMFQLVKCHKFENLQMEFGKLQSLVELDLFGYTKLGCLLNCIIIKAIQHIHKQLGKF
jgi:hypothetical protein